MSGSAPEAGPAREGTQVRHPGREILHALFTLRGPRSAFHRAGWPGRGAALAAGLGAGLAALLRPGPGLYDYDRRAPRLPLRIALGDLWQALSGGRGR